MNCQIHQGGGIEHRLRDSEHDLAAHQQAATNTAHRQYVSKNRITY